MNSFKETLYENTLTDFEDDFSVYKFKQIVPQSYYVPVRTWLVRVKSNIDDEFVSEAIDDLIKAIDGDLSMDAGVNFTFMKKKISLGVTNETLSMTSNKKIDISTLKNLLKVK